MSKVFVSVTIDGIDPNKVGLEIVEAISSPMVTHLKYGVRSRA